MKLKLDFLGKDSVRYKEEIEIPDFVGKALKEVLAEKGEKVFSVGETDVNNFLRDCLPFCTAKLFRTAYGTKLLAEELQAHPTNSSMTANEKKQVYNNAALAVSKKLNHQKNVSKTFDGQMEKIDQRIEKAEDELSSLKVQVKEKIEKINVNIKKFKNSIVSLKEKIEKVPSKDKLLIKSYKDMIESKKSYIKNLEGQIVKLKESIKKKQEQIQKLKNDKSFKKETKNIAINTAKTNYSSPKIAYSFCKANDIPISTVYSKSLAEKFDWAEDVEEDYYMNFPNND